MLPYRSAGLRLRARPTTVAMMGVAMAATAPAIMVQARATTAMAMGTVVATAPVTKAAAMGRGMARAERGSDLRSAAVTGGVTKSMRRWK